MHILITGGMGCGKSTITTYLRSRLPDFTFIDIDVRVRAMYDEKITKLQLLAAFGTHNRREISDIVFADASKKKLLYAIMNDGIFAHIIEASKLPNVVMDMPLYFEMRDNGDIAYEPDVKICVVCDKDEQVQRIRKRDGFTDDKIFSILSQQLPLDVKQRRSDFVIDTTQSREESIQQLEVVLKRIGV